jgi:hypothetical protein
MMDRKSELYALWQIEEGLLQQYRSMAITLLGLIAAGLLVIIAYIMQTFSQFSYVHDQFFGQAVVIFIYSTLLFLGIYGNWNFQNICEQRSAIVTFFQNLIIAEENDALDKILDKHKIEKKIPFISIRRRINSPESIPLPFEYQAGGNLSEFIIEMRQSRSLLGQSYLRHARARYFLSTFIYRVYSVFFFFCLIMLLVFVLKYIDFKR